MTSGYDQLEIIADFFNTHDRRMRYEGDPGNEHLTEPGRLMEWLLQHQLIAEPDDAASEEELQLARELRDELRKTIVNNEHDGVGEQVKLEQLTKSFQFGLMFHENGERLVPLHVNAAKGLAQLLIIVYELRRTKIWHRIRVCTAKDCQWVFVDRSRPGTGRWCSMKACGNRAKNKTFRHKHHKSETTI